MGFEASRPDLFRQSVVYVTPCRDGEQAVREVVDFWQTVLEAEPVVLDADRHDAQLAATSHLPQIVASLLGDFLASTRRPARRSARAPPIRRDWPLASRHCGRRSCS